MSERADMALLLDRYELDPALDPERLPVEGGRAAREGRPEAEEQALHWLEEQASVRRLEIASLYLTGLWNRRPSGQPVEARSVRRLLAVREAVPPEPGSQHACLHALGEALRPDSPEDARALLLEVLEDALREPLPPPRDRLVALIVSRAFRRVGVGPPGVTS